MKSWMTNERMYLCLLDPGTGDGGGSDLSRCLDLELSMSLTDPFLHPPPPGRVLVSLDFVSLYQSGTSSLSRDLFTRSWGVSWDNPPSLFS